MDHARAFRASYCSFHGVWTMPEHSEQVSFHGVSEEKLRNFVTTYLAGHLRPAGKGKTQCLSFHFPKTHGEHKCRSGRFSRTYTGGSLTFNPKSGIVVFRTPRKSGEPSLTLSSCGSPTSKIHALCGRKSGRIQADSISSKRILASTGASAS